MSNIVHRLGHRQAEGLPYFTRYNERYSPECRNAAIAMFTQGRAWSPEDMAALWDAANLEVQRRWLARAAEAVRAIRDTGSGTARRKRAEGGDG